MRPVRVTSVLVAGAAAAGLFAACTDPTEIEVHVATDLPCDGLTTRVTGGRDVAETSQCGPSAREGIEDIGTIVLLPSGARDDAVTITATAARGKSPDECAPGGDPACVVARRKLRFIPRRRLEVNIDLRAACLGQSCDPDSTCVLGACVPAVIDDPSLAAEADAASTYDAAVFVDSPPGDAPADVVLDGSTNPDAPLGPCAAGVLVSGIVGATIAELTVGKDRLYYVAGAIAHSVDIATGADTPLLALGQVRRISADGNALYFTNLGSGVSVFAGGKIMVIDPTVTPSALYAAPGGANNPYYVAGSTVYANGAGLFPLTGAVGPDAEIVTTAKDLWLVAGTSLYRGPIGGRVTNVAPLYTSVTGTGSWHDLSTNGARVDWIETDTTSLLQSYDIAQAKSSFTTTTSLRLSLTTLGLYHDEALGLVRESPDYPAVTPASKIIDPIKPAGRIVATPTCVYFYAPSTIAGGQFEILAAPP